MRALVGIVLAASSLGGSAPARLQIVAHEYGFGLSRLQLHRGAATIELENVGQDPHDLRLRRAGSRHVAGTREAAPGERVLLNVRLRPGRYFLWCAIADHRARGMRATLIVR